MVRKYKRFLDKPDEINWLFEHNLIIRCTYNGPKEGYEYYLIHIGGMSGRDEIHTAKSERACFNYAKRNIDAITNK